MHFHNIMKVMNDKDILRERGECKQTIFDIVLRHS
jgi:hypothetical protein